MLGQPIAMLIPDGGRHAADRARPRGRDRRRTLCSPSRRSCASSAWSASSSSSSAPGWTTWPSPRARPFANMAPEYGATCGFFPVDAATLEYLRLTGATRRGSPWSRAYSKAQGMWRDSASADPVFCETVELDLSTVEPSLAGPKRPQDRVPLSKASSAFKAEMTKGLGVPAQRRGHAHSGARQELRSRPRRYSDRGHHQLHQHVQPLCDGCRRSGGPQGECAGPEAEAVGEDLAGAGQPGGDRVSGQVGPDKDLDAMGFALGGHGCTTCIGNSGPLDDTVTEAIEDGKLVVRVRAERQPQLEGRVHPLTRANLPRLAAAGGGLFAAEAR